MKKKAKIIILISGISGAGKTVIVNGLIEHRKSVYMRPVSYTTRDKREEEPRGEYIFVDKEWLMEEYRLGRVMNLDYVYGNYYSVSKTDIINIWQKGMIPIKEVHPENISKFKNQDINCISILIKRELNEIKNRGYERFVDDFTYYNKLSDNKFNLIIENNSIEDAIMQIDSFIMKLFKHKLQI